MSFGDTETNQVPVSTDNTMKMRAALLGILAAHVTRAAESNTADDGQPWIVDRSLEATVEGLADHYYVSKLSTVVLKVVAKRRLRFMAPSPAKQTTQPAETRRAALDFCRACAYQ